MNDNEILAKVLFNLHTGLKSQSIVDDEAIQEKIFSIVEKQQKILDKILRICQNCYPDEAGLARRIMQVILY